MGWQFWQPDVATGTPAYGMVAGGHLVLPPPPGMAYMATAAPMSAAEERSWAMWAHLGALLVGVLGVLTVVLGLFAFVVPLIIMQTKGQRSAFVRAHAVESLNFQLFGLIVVLSTLLISVLTLGFGLLILIIPIVIYIVLCLIWMIMATTTSNRGAPYRYPINIRFVK